MFSPLICLAHRRKPYETLVLFHKSLIRLSMIHESRVLGAGVIDLNSMAGLLEAHNLIHIENHGALVDWIGIFLIRGMG